jgi:hypothetical protein
MARDDDDETPWTRQLLVGVGVLLAVALVIGGVASVFALGAAKVSGIDDASPTPTTRPSLYLPSGDPTTTGGPSAGSSDGTADGTGGGPSGTPSRTPTRRPRNGISLRAAPTEVAANERITLTGSYRGHPGVTLQVQRFDGGWVDFPVTVTVNGGTFSTYITTGRTGVNRLRVVDPASPTPSNAVRVVVR